MKKLSLFALLLSISVAAMAQNVRVRGTITSLDGDVLSVRTREGKDIKLQLTSDAGVAVATRMTLADIKPDTYVGVTSVEQNGRMVAKEVHLIPPQAPAGHMKWDLLPGSMMTNANLASVGRVSGGNEITLKYKDGEQKILVPADTPIRGSRNGTRDDLKKGETVWTNARVGSDGKLTTNRVQVSKDGVKPEH